MVGERGGERGEDVVRAEQMLAKNSLAHEESSRAKKATDEATKRTTQRTGFDAVASQRWWWWLGARYVSAADAVVPDGDENADNLPPGLEAPPRAVTNQWRLGKTCNESLIKPNSEQQEVVVTAELKPGDKMINLNESQEPEP